MGPNASSGGGTATTQNLGGAITGGAFYDGTRFPAAYRGNFFFGDYNSGNMIRAAVGPGTTVTRVDIFNQNAINSIDVAPGPDGALYQLAQGGQIYRTTYPSAVQGIVLSDAHRLVHEGQAVVFTVSLATAPASPVTVLSTRTSGTTDLTVATGSTLVFTPANFAVPQTVRLEAANDDDLTQESAVVTVSSTGLTSETVQVSVLDLSGNAGAGGPGRVPDGGPVPGVPLTITRGVGPGSLDLDWGASCAATADDYAVYEGVLGSWYSHTAAVCSTSGVLEATLNASSGDRYYLVVPLDDQSEGSYGTDSSGAERPRPGAHCRTQRNTTACP